VGPVALPAASPVFGRDDTGAVGVREEQVVELGQEPGRCRGVRRSGNWRSGVARLRARGPRTGAVDVVVFLIPERQVLRPGRLWTGVPGLG
jgi:hypothetical protein